MAEPDSNPSQLTDAEILDTVVEEFTNRLRSGEHPSIAEFQERQPHLKEEIEDLLASVVMIEQLKSAANVTPSPNRKLLNEVSKLKRIGHYVIEREIGRGGMGVVFEGIHEALGRQVAIKVMPTPLVNSEKYIQRFRREAKAAANLHHTNIVGVFEAGEGDGFHYYVMDFIDGRGLNEVVKGFKDDQPSTISIANGATREDINQVDDELSYELQDTDREIKNVTGSPRHFRWAARIGSNIANALAYAHQANILHRDIKPSNLILDNKGTVWITDFGLAKDISNEINLTKTGDVIGTPQYLAPESLEGKYDKRSEVYCLGLTLYELATLEPAYKSGSTAEVIRAIANQSPVSPKRINPKIPIDLSTIIDKSLSRAPEDRYQSAQEMADDLTAFIQDRPISARRPSTLETVIKWSKRNPVEAGFSLATATLLTLVAVFASLAQLNTGQLLEEQEKRLIQLQIKEREILSNQNETAKAKKQSRVNAAVAAQSLEGMIRRLTAVTPERALSIQSNCFGDLSFVKSDISSEEFEYLNQLLGRLDRLSANNDDNNELAFEIASIYRLVAGFFLNVGENQQAIIAIEKAEKLYDRLYIESEIDQRKTIVIPLVETLNELSRTSLLSSDKSEFENANIHCFRALELIEQVYLSDSDRDLDFARARTLSTLAANTAANLGKTSDTEFLVVSNLSSETEPKKQPKTTEAIASVAKDNAEQAIQILNILLNLAPENFDYNAVYAECQFSLAASDRILTTKRFNQSRSQAIEAFEKALKLRPGCKSCRFRLAQTCSFDLDKTAINEPDNRFLERAKNISDQLNSESPKSTAFQQLYVNNRINLASARIKQNKFQEALNLLSDAFRVTQLYATNLPKQRSSVARSSLLQVAQQLMSKEKGAEPTIARSINELIQRIQSELK